MSSVPLEEKFCHELTAATVTRHGLLYINKQKINWVEGGQVRVQELLPAQRSTAAALGIALTSLIDTVMSVGLVQAYLVWIRCGIINI